MRRVLITRQHSAPMHKMLQARGCVSVHVPLIELAATGAPPPRGVPDRVLVTSASTARFAPDLARYLRGAKIVAVGAKTASALRRIGLEPAAVGQEGGARAVGLLAGLSGDVVWYIGARERSAELDAALEDWGRPHARWAVYENRVPQDASARLRAAVFSVATFASASAARRYVELGGRSDVKVAVIGASTAAGAREVGLRVDAIAAQPSLEALCAAAARLG